MSPGSFLAGALGGDCATVATAVATDGDPRIAARTFPTSPKLPAKLPLNTPATVLVANRLVKAVKVLKAVALAACLAWPLRKELHRAWKHL